MHYRLLFWKNLAEEVSRMLGELRPTLQFLARATQLVDSTIDVVLENLLLVRVFVSLPSPVRVPTKPKQALDITVLRVKLAWFYQSA